MNNVILFYKETPASEELRQKQPDKRPVVELVTAIKLHPGQELFQFEISSKKVSPVILHDSYPDCKLMVRNGYLYAPAINKKNASVKFLKMLGMAANNLQAALQQ